MGWKDALAVAVVGEAAAPVGIAGVVRSGFIPDSGTFVVLPVPEDNTGGVMMGAVTDAL